MPPTPVQENLEGKDPAVGTPSWLFLNQHLVHIMLFTKGKQVQISVTAAGRRACFKDSHKVVNDLLRIICCVMHHKHPKAKKSEPGIKGRANFPLHP